MIILGSQVRDKVSGLIGTAVTRLEYMNGCVQYTVTAKLVKGKSEINSWNIDEEQIEVMPKKRIKIKKKPTGGATTLAKERY